MSIRIYTAVHEVGRVCSTYGEKSGAYRVFVGKPERRMLLGISRGG
jgi:hypothetical protein